MFWLSRVAESTSSVSNTSRNPLLFWWKPGNLKRLLKRTSLQRNIAIFLARLDYLDAPLRVSVGASRLLKYTNVERAYLEFRRGPPDAQWDTSATFDTICQVAKARGLHRFAGPTGELLSSGWPFREPLKSTTWSRQHSRSNSPRSEPVVKSLAAGRTELLRSPA